MKRAPVLAAILLTITSAGSFNASLRAQDASTAAAVADKQAADERAERAAADLQALQAANEALQNRVDGLEAEIRKLRDDQARLANNTDLRDDLKRLADRVDEIDHKREDDKAAIAAQIREAINGLEKSLAESSTSAPHHSTVTLSTNAEPDAAIQNGFGYIIKDGDRLSEIVKAYNADYKSKGWKQITLKQAMDANPAVDWNRLKVGQKIVIPRPAD